MVVMMQAAIRFKPGKTVPSPYDGDPSTPWWWDHIASQANDLRKAGFTSVLLPPFCKSNAGAFPGADGYGCFDDYDLGSKDQFYSIPTRYGTREQLQRCTAIMRANGLDVYADFVCHQRQGGRAGVYRYLGADGKTKNGRFPKDPGCFLGDAKDGRSPRDPIAGPVEFDYAFGDQLCPVNGKPKGYVMENMIAAGDWQTQSLDLQGYRIDDTKGMAVEFVSNFMNSKSMKNNFGVGEYYDGNPNTLGWWVYDSGMEGRCSTFDFGTHFAVRNMCNNNSKWDMRQLGWAGFANYAPMKAVTFVENMDTDTNGHGSVIWNKILGYAFILTSEGYPCVYYRDYAEMPGCYGLKKQIDNLVWIHENLAHGTTTKRFADYQTYVFERNSDPGLLVGLNNDQYSGWRTVRVHTNFGSNVHLHDYTGHANDIWTDNYGWVEIAIPPNNNGRGFVCYSRAGESKSNYVNTLETHQMFEGADDLDIPPISNSSSIHVGRIWCQKHTPITLRLELNKKDWTKTTKVTMQMTNPEATIIHQASPMFLKSTATVSGWHDIYIVASSLPDPGTTPFKLYSSYTATKTLDKADFVIYPDTPVTPDPITPG